MGNLIISAPFGNYLRCPGVVSTLGTYTLHRRAGLLLRLWRAVRTIRPWPRAGAWVNRMGLPSPGVDSLLHPGFRNLGCDILSIHGFTVEEWKDLVVLYPQKLARFAAVELNVSCPNVKDDPEMLAGAIHAARLLHRRGIRVIAKLPPLRWMDLARPLYEEAGVRAFHCCNTIPTPAGGMSGKPLKNYSLWAVEELRERWGEEVHIIGGGGVTALQDVKDYLAAGADDVAIGTMLFNPFNWKKVPEMCDYLKSVGIRRPSSLTEPIDPV